MVMPLVVICILPFVFLLRMLLFQMIMENAVDSCMREMAAELYILDRISIMPEYEEEETVSVDANQLEQIKALVNEYTGLFEDEQWKEKLEAEGYELLGELLLRQRLEKWMQAEDLEEWGVKGGWSGVELGKSEFFYFKEDHHHLLKAIVEFDWENQFAFWDPATVSIQRVYHTFVREEGYGSADSEEEEVSSDSIIVYRIGQGNRYHSANCYLIQKNIFTSTKSNAEKAGMLACERCKPTEQVTVYRTSGGTHYHTNDCSYLHPDLSSLTLEEALNKGYSGCGICQGGSDYFS